MAARKMGNHPGLPLQISKTVISSELSIVRFRLRNHGFSVVQNITWAESDKSCHPPVRAGLSRPDCWSGNKAPRQGLSPRPAVFRISRARYLPKTTFRHGNHAPRCHDGHSRHYRNDHSLHLRFLLNSLHSGQISPEKKLSIDSFLFKGGSQNRIVPSVYLFFGNEWIFRKGIQGSRIGVSGALEFLFFFSGSWGFPAAVFSSRAGVQIS